MYRDARAEVAADPLVHFEEQGVVVGLAGVHELVDLIEEIRIRLERSVAVGDVVARGALVAVDDHQQVASPHVHEVRTRSQVSGQLLLIPETHLVGSRDFRARDCPPPRSRCS